MYASQRSPAKEGGEMTNLRFEREKEEGKQQGGGGKIE